MTLPDLLTACNLSQAQAAKLLGVGLRTMHGWCNGRGKPPPYLVGSLTLYADDLIRAREKIAKTYRADRKNQSQIG